MATSQQWSGPAVLRTELLRVVEAAIDRLPDALRAVFVLCQVEDMPVEGIAAALELPPGLVRARHRRARCLVRDCVAREIDGAMEDVFAFAGARCDRIVARVLARVEEPPRRGG